MMTTRMKVHQSNDKKGNYFSYIVSHHVTNIHPYQYDSAFTIQFLYRLVQNRKSAKKCRMKKKDEYNRMKKDITLLIQENRFLKQQVNFHIF